MLDSLFLIAAVVGGTVMICQFALTLMGMGDDGADAVADDGVGDVDGGGDFDADVGEVGDAEFGDGADHHTSMSTAADAEFHHDTSWLFGVLSFRTLIAAAAFFGVTGKAALSSGMAQSTSLVLATLVGLSAMYSMYWLMRGISRLTSSGNERIRNAVGCPATVYIPIPAAQQGAGKVQLSMQNRIVEYQAITEDAEKLKTGENVIVVGVAGSDVVRVRRVGEPATA
jgi:membrane protein implicated in regulation of membrane protease activity